MKKHIEPARKLFLSAAVFALSLSVFAERLPESLRDSVPSLKDCYASYFAVGASSYVDSEEDDRIKDKEKEEKKKAKEQKKKEKDAEKARKKAEKEQKKNQKKKDDADNAVHEYEDVGMEEKSSDFIKTVQKHFTELSSGTDLLPFRLLGKKPGKLSYFLASDGCRYEVPAKWNSQYLALFLDDAKKTGVQVRFHLLVCPEMSPEWFFFRGYDTASRLASKEEMTARIEWYVKTVTDFVADWEHEHNQGKTLVTSYDVASELFTDAGTLNKTPSNYLMKIFGDDSFAVHAFVYAAKCIPASVKLCYCDHSLFERKKAERIMEFIGSVRSSGRKSRVDEIGIISHLTTDWPERKAFFDACRNFSAVHLDVQIQQLDMAPDGGTDSGAAYYDFMKACVQNAACIQGVSFRAVNACNETEFVDYMRAPLFSSDFSCTGNFDSVVEAVGRSRR